MDHAIQKSDIIYTKLLHDPYLYIALRAGKVGARR